MITEEQIRSRATLADLSDIQVQMVLDLADRAQQAYDEALSSALNVKRPDDDKDPVAFWKQQALQVRKKASLYGETGTAPLIGDVVDVSTAGSRVEAMAMVQQALRAAKIAPTDPRYEKIKNATWEKIVRPLNLKLQ